MCEFLKIYYGMTMLILSQAAVVSTIAISDYPDEWPNLLSDLVNLLQSPSSDSVHGAMQVVDEFARNILAEDQIVPVIKEFLPVLLAILRDPTRHSATTRTLAVKVYVEVLKTLETVRDEHPQAVREALGIIGQPWVECFKGLIGVDLGDELRRSWETLPLYTEIFGVSSSLNSLDRADLSLRPSHSSVTSFRKSSLRTSSLSFSCPFTPCPNSSRRSPPFIFLLTSMPLFRPPRRLIPAAMWTWSSSQPPFSSSWTPLCGNRK